MDNKGTESVLIQSDILLNNDEYFKYIFKKTEKVVSAVFYTTRSIGDTNKKDTLIELVEDRALTVSAVAFTSLTTPSRERREVLENLRATLVALESGLTLLVVSRIMREDLLEVFRHEIAMLQRSIRDYLYTGPRHPFEEEGRGIERDGGRQRIRESIERTPRREVYKDSSSGVIAIGRRDRILSILRDKGQVTIKDVSTAITDVSEKTIQRELMSLISDGIIVKEGERRWSKYSIAKA